MVLLLSEWQWWRQARGLRCCYCWGLELELGHCEGEEKISLKSTKGFWPKLLGVQQPAILSQSGHLHYGSGQICAPFSLRWALATAFTFAIRTRFESDVGGQCWCIICLQCYAARPQLYVSDRRWRQAECKPHSSALLWSQAECVAVLGQLSANSVS